MQIDIKRLIATVHSKESEALAHPKHGENDLCSGCLIKRALWDVREIQQLAENCQEEMFTRIAGNVPPKYIFLEAIALGFELAIAYKENEQLEKLEVIEDDKRI